MIKTEQQKTRPTLVLPDPLITSALQSAGVDRGTDTWFKAQQWGKKILSDRNAWSINSHREKAELRRVFK